MGSEFSSNKHKFTTEKSSIPANEKPPSTSIGLYCLSGQREIPSAHGKKDNLESSFDARKASRAILFLNLTNFKFGLGTGEDVFDALSVYARTAGNYFEAIFDSNMSVADLNSLIGDLGKTQE